MWGMWILHPGAYAWVGMRVGVMESLFKLDDGMNVQKNLVDDYSVSEDGLVWTLKLRDGVLFQSGNRWMQRL